ncbi:MAG TPA: HD domain-containing protein [Clostridiales bacterium]|jgi:dGTPase|nr:HD domain-containing protein [Clostridiales bacterium]
MSRDLYRNAAIQEGNPKWEACIQRQELYEREDDIRSPFVRDYTRILHCTAYRRLKHKTQVFFAAKNDHICTRIEHVNHVASISYTISKYLGLNTELATAIATGHDLGHSPFGHEGEYILSEIAEEYLGDKFWHEGNSLRFVDKCETLTGPDGEEYNLNLTYAVRDGILLHCGEVDDKVLFPRNEHIDLCTVTDTGQYSPYTWEGCVVKIADKIAFLGRDIEDALHLNILTETQLNEFSRIIEKNRGAGLSNVNNTEIIHNLILDICKSSSPETGIRFSQSNLTLLKELREFSSTNIYNHERLKIFKRYARLIIESIFKTLKDAYRKERTLEFLQEKYLGIYPLLIKHYMEWLQKYANNHSLPDFKRSKRYKNVLLYDMLNERDYIQSIIDFISGMTDSFAIRIFNELTTF